MSVDLQDFLSGTGFTFGTVGGLFTSQILQVSKGLLIDPLAEQYLPKRNFARYFNDPEELGDKPAWGLVVREVLIWLCIICCLYILFTIATSQPSPDAGIPPEIVQQLAAAGKI